MDVFWRNRLIFVRDDRGVGDAADKRLIAVVIAADGREFHFSIGDTKLRQRGTRQHVRHRIWSGYRDLLALEILDLGDLFVRVYSVRHDDPVAAEQLDVGAFGVGGEDPLWSTLETVQFARDQGLQGKLVILELGNFNLQALIFCEIARRYHQQDTSVGLGVDQSVFPDFFLCASGDGQNGTEGGDNDCANSDSPCDGTAHCEVAPGVSRVLCSGRVPAILTSILPARAFPSAVCGTSLCPASVDKRRAFEGRPAVSGRPFCLFRELNAMIQKFTLTVNGKSHTVNADPDMPLLYALRDELGLNNPHFGCGLAQCGACTVHLDGQPARSCITTISA